MTKSLGVCVCVFLGGCFGPCFPPAAHIGNGARLLRLAIELLRGPGHAASDLVAVRELHREEPLDVRLLRATWEGRGWGGGGEEVHHFFRM